ncbi:uncharacterized protein [Dysidea avara]
MWRQLGVQLNVANHLLRIIEKNHPNDCEGCCSKMLQEWLDSNSNASWEVLTDILANFQLADNVTAGSTHLNQQPQHSIQNITTDTHAEESDERQLRSRTITKLKGKYAKVAIKIKHEFEQQKYDVRELILTLSASDDENQTIFSTDEAFVKITNTDDLFLWIGKYCSMYDYELLLALVEFTECEETIKLLDDFSKELQSSILKDLDLLSEDGELLDIKSFMPRTHKLEIKYVGGDFTLKAKKSIQSIMYECFRLKRGSIIFRGAQEGCVVFIYQISTTVKSHLLQYQITSQDVMKLTDHKIKCIKIDDTELNLSPQSKEVVSDNTDHTDVSDIPEPLDFTNMLSKQLDKIITSLGPEDLEATLSTLRKIFDNIIQHANDNKYRQIKLANKTFISKVWRYPACEELMKLSGWVVEVDHVRLRDDSHVHIVSQLLESFYGHKDVNKKQAYSSSSVTTYSVDTYEALISTLLNGNMSEIRHLLKPCNITAAGRIYCENGSSQNLLYAAVLNQKIDVVELLAKEYSVDPYVVDDNNSTLLVYQVFYIAPQSFIVNFLKICGVKTFFKSTKSGITLLHYAVFTWCFHVVCFLVEEYEVDVNMCDNGSLTPLHMAYMTGHAHITQYLIQHGADMMALNDNGYTPYDYIDGIPEHITLSQAIQNCRIIHQVPGSAEYMYYIKLRNIEINVKGAVALTMEKFPSLTEDGPTQLHHDIDHTSFTKELTQYITKRSSSDQPWEALKSDQTSHLQFMF